MSLTLRSSDNNSLLQVLDHEGETAGGEAHRVCAVQYDERVVPFIPIGLLS